MRVFTLDREMFVPADPTNVFNFFASAKNLEELTPPWLTFQILNPEVEMCAGARIDYRLRIHGFPIRWQSRITVWDPPVCFIDQQTRGPYRLWIHEHHVEAGTGGTV